MARKPRKEAPPPEMGEDGLPKELPKLRKAAPQKPKNKMYFGGERHRAEKEQVKREAEFRAAINQEGSLLPATLPDPAVVEGLVPSDPPDPNELNKNLPPPMRRQLMALYLCQGGRPRDMPSMFGVTERTVFSDLKWVREHGATLDPHNRLNFRNLVQAGIGARGEKIIKICDDLVSSTVRREKPWEDCPICNGDGRVVVARKTTKVTVGEKITERVDEKKALCPCWGKPDIKGVGLLLQLTMRVITDSTKQFERLGLIEKEQTPDSQDWKRRFLSQMTLEEKRAFSEGRGLPDRMRRRPVPMVRSAEAELVQEDSKGSASGGDGPPPAPPAASKPLPMLTKGTYVENFDWVNSVSIKAGFDLIGLAQE